MSEASSDSIARPFAWRRYPSEFAALVLQHLDFKELLVAEQVCTQWLHTGKELQQTPKFVKDKYHVLFGEFIQVDDNCMYPLFVLTKNLKTFPSSQYLA